MSVEGQHLEDSMKKPTFRLPEEMENLRPERWNELIQKTGEAVAYYFNHPGEITPEVLLFLADIQLKVLVPFTKDTSISKDQKCI